MIRGITRKYYEGKACIFCDKYGFYRLKDGRVKCKHCKRYYSIHKLRRNIRILYYFYLEVSARKTAKELNLNYETVQSKFMQFREHIADHCIDKAEDLGSSTGTSISSFLSKENDENDAVGNAMAFAVVDDNGRIFTVIVPNAPAEVLMQKMENKWPIYVVFHTNEFKSYISLCQYKNYGLMNSKEDKAKSSGARINRIEGFWSYAKERFHKYHSINKKNFPFYLKEMEFRFNNRNDRVFNDLFNICIKEVVGANFH